MRKAALLTALIYMNSGCAALMMSSPKSDSPAEPPRCSESRAGVVLDGVFAGLYGLTGMLALSEGASEASLLLGGLGAVHVVSAVAGNRSAARCTKAHEEHQAWLETEALRPSVALDRDEIMGVAGSACYPNGTCNAGLTCDPDTKLCALPRPATTATGSAAGTTTPAARPTAAPGSSTPVATTSSAPAATTTARPKTPVATTPAPSTPPADKPADKSTDKSADKSAGDSAGPSDRSPPGRARPQAPPRRAERPPRQPTPSSPSNDEPWGSFWREVK